MKNNTNTNTNTTRARFNYLKTMFRQAPLDASELTELKTLAEKFDPKMAKWINENPEFC